MSKQLLLHAAKTLCDDFAGKRDFETLIAHFSKSSPVTIEHADPKLAPFVGREFVGTSGIKEYYTILGGLLDYRDMIFDDYIVDVESMKVVVRGRATFVWKSTGKEWDEYFIYVIDFDEAMKVKRHQIWADSGSAYLASLLWSV